MKKILMTVFAVTSLLISGCSQQIARNWGGNSSIDLPKGEKLVMITWKNDSLWTLTEPMENGYHAKVYKYREHSAFGALEGVVTIREREWK